MAVRKFKPSLITPVLMAFAVIGSLQTPVQGQTVEYWNTSAGELQLTDKGAHNYSGTFNGNKLYGTRSNRGNFIGHWINNKRDTPRCPYPIDGSYYWGPVQLNFTTNRFSGKFGACDYPPGASWTGQLKMTGFGNSGSNMTGFFQSCLQPSIHDNARNPDIQDARRATPHRHLSQWNNRNHTFVLATQSPRREGGARHLSKQTGETRRLCLQLRVSLRFPRRILVQRQQQPQISLVWNLQ